MRKILLIANYKGAVGGISGQVEELHKNLNCEATSACIGNSKLVNGNCKYHADIFSTQGSVVRRIVKFIELIFVARGYDVLHIHGCSEWGSLPIIYGVIAGKIWRKRIIITYHGGGAEEFFIRHAHFVRRWLNRADKVIVLNGYLESVFTKYGIPCIVIPNIIELSETQEHSDYQWDAPRFISVRHLRELYNIPCILQAFAMVKERLPKATLTILGDGPQRAELEDLHQERVGAVRLEQDHERGVAVAFGGQRDGVEPQVDVDPAVGGAQLGGAHPVGFGLQPELGRLGDGPDGEDRPHALGHQVDPLPLAGAERHAFLGGPGVLLDQPADLDEIVAGLE